MNTTYAYFTATAAKNESTTTTATIKISLSNFDSSGYTTVTSEENTINYILPGDTLTVGGTLTNSGSSPCYAIIEFSVIVQKQGKEAEVKEKRYYTFVNNDDSSYTKTEITGTENNYSTNAAIILKDGTRDFTFTYTFTGADYNNDYKNASATFAVRAHAIQTENLAETEAEAAQEATNLLIANLNK